MDVGLKGARPRDPKGEGPGDPLQNLPQDRPDPAILADHNLSDLRYRGLQVLTHWGQLFISL